MVPVMPMPVAVPAVIARLVSVSVSLSRNVSSVVAALVMMTPAVGFSIPGMAVLSVVRVWLGTCIGVIRNPIIGNSQVAIMSVKRVRGRARH